MDLYVRKSACLHYRPRSNCDAFSTYADRWLTDVGEQQGVENVSIVQLESVGLHLLFLLFIKFGHITPGGWMEK